MGISASKPTPYEPMNQGLIDFYADLERSFYEEKLLKDPSLKYVYPANEFLINQCHWDIPQHRADICAILADAFSDKQIEIRFQREGPFEWWHATVSFIQGTESSEPRKPKLEKRAVPPDTKTDLEVPIEDDLKTEYDELL